MAHFSLMEYEKLSVSSLMEMAKEEKPYYDAAILDGGFLLINKKKKKKKLLEGGFSIGDKF